MNSCPGRPGFGPGRRIQGFRSGLPRFSSGQLGVRSQAGQVPGQAGQVCLGWPVFSLGKPGDKVKIESGKKK